MTEPEFSIIIPAYNVQGYLRQAVMSVANDASVQVIVVDDRSTDGTAMIADELSSLHTSVEVVRPSANVGLGRARNLGLDQARGKYVLFLDGDDYFATGAIERLRIAVAAEPDLVIFGYERLYPNGDRIEGAQREPLQIEGSFSATEHPEIFDVLNVAWNKAYRRDLLATLGLEFPVGYYEDIPWTYPILAAAASIVAIDEPLYLYRQRQSGSILRSTDARHVEIVDQFERLMDIMATLDTTDPMRGEVYTRGFRNMVTLATTWRGRIPKELRRTYYMRVQAAVRARRPANYVLPTAGEKWKLMGVMSSWGYTAFAARVWVSRQRRRFTSAVRGGARGAVRSVRRLYHHRWTYRLERRIRRVDPKLVVMENLWGLSPRLNCRAVDAELRGSHPDLRILWSVTASEAKETPPDFDVVVKGTHAYFSALARAKFFFLDTNLPGWWRKRPGQVFTELHHGTPLKLMGVEERGKDREWMNGLLLRSQNWDFSVVSSEYCAEVWKHSYPVRCETLEYGYPRNDVLVNAGPEAMAAARIRLQLGAGARVVLYMPTFRERDQDTVSAADLNVVASALESDDVLLMRGHYLAGRSAGAELHPAVRDVTNYPVVEDLYLAADVLVTDYSSAMFDFANLRRPVVILANDWDHYRYQRGTYFDITVDAPGPVAYSAEELAEVLARRSYESEDNRARMERFAAIFCSFETGHAATDIVAHVIDGERRSLAERPAPPHLRSWEMERMA